MFLILFTSLAQLLCNYELKGNYADTLGNCEDLQKVGLSFEEFGDAGLKWIKTPDGYGGFILVAPRNLNSGYSLDIEFSYDSVGGWAKTVDFKNRTSDYGLYVRSGSMIFYGASLTGFAFTPNVLYHMVFSFNGTSDLVRLTLIKNSTIIQTNSIIDGSKQAMPYTSPKDESVFVLFMDDSAPSENPPGGIVKHVRLWNQEISGVPPEIDLNMKTFTRKGKTNTLLFLSIISLIFD